MTYFQEIQDDTRSSSLQFIVAHYNNKTTFHKYISEEGRLSAPQSFTKKSAQAIVKFIDKGEINRQNLDFEGLIPQNVIRYRTEERYIVWHTPEQNRRLLFAKGLGIESTNYPIPRLLWKLEGNSLSVFALKKDIENLDEELCQAPFLNVSDDGIVCMGTANIPQHLTTYEDVMEQADKAFFNSRFTHTNTDNLATRSITDIYAEQREKKTQRFSSSLLLEINQNINDIL